MLVTWKYELIKTIPNKLFGPEFSCVQGKATSNKFFRPWTFHSWLPWPRKLTCFQQGLCVCGSQMIYIRLQRPIITLYNHCAKFNMGDKGKSGANQRLCYLLSAYNVDYETAQGSDKHMGKEQGRNICTPADHTVAGKTLSHCQPLMKKKEM